MYHHEFNYEHELDVVFDNGKFLLKLDNFKPIEVPREFGVQLGDLIYEIIEDSTKKERNRIANLIEEKINSSTPSQSEIEVLSNLIENILEDD